MLMLIIEDNLFTRFLKYLYIFTHSGIYSPPDSTGKLNRCRRFNYMLLHIVMRALQPHEEKDKRKQIFQSKTSVVV